MNKKYYKYQSRFFLVIMIAFLFADQAGFSQVKEKKIKTHSVLVNYSDSYANVTVLDKTKKKIHQNELVTYFWFADNKVMHTNGGYSGKLLHGAYVKYYSDNNLMQKGKFRYGLRDGMWIDWYKNGGISKISEYKRGLKIGQHKTFNEAGNLIQLVSYKKDRLHGNSILFSDGRITSKTRYRRGKEIVPRSKKKKESRPKKEKRSDKEKKPEKPKKKEVKEEKSDKNNKTEKID